MSAKKFFKKPSDIPYFEFENQCMFTNQALEFVTHGFIICAPFCRWRGLNYTGLFSLS